MPPHTQTVLITGASAGLGFEFAHLFARDKCNLVLVARSGPTLAQLAEQLRAEMERKLSRIADAGREDVVPGGPDAEGIEKPPV